MNTKEMKIVLESDIISRLRNIYDPEVPVNIYDLGLIYSVNIDDDFNATVVMTLTAPNCPVAETLPVEVKEAVASVPGIRNAEVEISFDPPWSQDMMSEEAMLELGFL